MFPFNSFSQDMINHLMPGQRAYQDILLGSTVEVESISAAGALSPSIRRTELSVSGTKAYTLAAPTYAGQTKQVVCVSATSTPLGTLTITSPDTTTGFVCSSTFTFNAVGQEITLQATPGLLWRCISVRRAGVLTVVVGTDVLTGLNLNQVYALSVTATVSSTGTKALPNGSAVGEICSLVNSVAASTPVGNINGTYKGPEGTARTDIGAIGSAASTAAMGDFATLQWDGSAWVVLNMSGVTLS